MTGPYRTLVSLVLAGTLAAMVVGIGGPARATVILDQASTGPAPGAGGLSNGINLGRAQTFTVGLAGILDSVEVSFFSSAGPPTTLRILATAGGVPIGGVGGSTVLATSSSLSSVGNVHTFDLSPSALVVAVGDVLAFELLGPGFYALSDLNPYAAGSTYFFNTFSGIGSWTIVPDVDTLFRTFVQVAMIPEPSALTLFAAGLVGLGFAARRRKRAQDISVA